MALHCADISNPVKDISIYKKWVIVVMTEFYQQGDKERELKMPISPMFDRNNSSVSKTQSGFIEFIIKPIYRIWGEFIPELKDTFTDNLAVGKAFDWDTYYNGVIDGSITEIHEHKGWSTTNSIKEYSNEGMDDKEGEVEKREEEEGDPGEKVPPQMVESQSTPSFK